MHSSAMTNGGESALHSLTDIGSTFGRLASGLDARFVRAGTALSTAYEIVERLLTSLEGVTNALNRQAADAAIDTMRSTADRLTRLPMEQDLRQRSLVSIQTSSRELGKHLNQIRRTLDFLRICGLNIKVTAAGAEGFANFADHMLERLDQAERQVDEFDTEIQQLAQGINGLAKADRLLAAECTTVIPKVPQQLAANVIALQQHQADTAAIAEQTAAIARDIRSKVAVALGALQIGDITRQRLEHVSESADLLAAVLDEQADGHADTLRPVRDHVVALLAAQAADAVGDFLREARTLTDSLRGIGPDADRLIAMRHEGAAGDESHVLERLEQDIGEIESVTQRLRTADADSARFGRATSESAESLAQRLKAVRRIQLEVEQMAWNTALRCRDMGADGRGLAVLSAEIQNFSHGLAAIWTLVSATFDDIDAAASTIRVQLADAADTDTDATLMQSLDAIRSGNAHMVDSLSGIDREASEVADILHHSTGDVDCEAGIGAELLEAVDGLSTLAASAVQETEGPEMPEDAAALLGDLLGRIAARYTMAREREIHRAFAVSAGALNEVPELTGGATDDDDGLFDDGLF